MQVRAIIAFLASLSAIWISLCTPLHVKADEKREMILRAKQYQENLDRLNRLADSCRAWGPFLSYPVRRIDGIVLRFKSLKANELRSRTSYGAIGIIRDQLFSRFDKQFPKSASAWRCISKEGAAVTYKTVDHYSPADNELQYSMTTFEKIDFRGFYGPRLIIGSMMYRLLTIPGEEPILLAPYRTHFEFGTFLTEDGNEFPAWQIRDEGFAHINTVILVKLPGGFVQYKCAKTWGNLGTDDVSCYKRQ